MVAGLTDQIDAIVRRATEGESPETAIGRSTATARRLVNASVSDNTRRAASSAAMAVAAARFRSRLAGQADRAGEQTARVLAGYRRTAGDRGRG